MRSGPERLMVARDSRLRGSGILRALLGEREAHSKITGHQAYALPGLSVAEA